MPDWAGLFDEVALEPAATEADLLRLQEDLRRPLAEEEIRHIEREQRCPWPLGHPYHEGWRILDPRGWQLPAIPLPPSYLSFLRWANGPWVRRGDRAIECLHSSKIREYLLAYHFPHYMPGAIPLALDGGGVFAVFDGRALAVDAEVPVLAVRSGNLGYEDARLAGGSFTEFCLGTTPIDEA